MELPRKTGRDGEDDLEKDLLGGIGFEDGRA
jgi:hypothetical protein